MIHSSKCNHILIIFTICILIHIICVCLYTYTCKNKESYQNRDFLSIICRVKNEHFHLDTFVPYYLSQGVDKIYFIDDNSERPYLCAIHDKVKFIPSTLARKTNKQMADVSVLYKRIRHHTKWILLIDADEYIYTKGNSTIRSLLQTEFRNVDCINIPWAMFSFENREHDGEDVIMDYTYRWNHDKTHVHKNPKSMKNRCRYNGIEVKSLFKGESFYDLNNPHIPANPIGRNIIVRDSIYNKNKSLSVMYQGLREKDIKNAIMICNHYRLSLIHI